MTSTRALLVLTASALLVPGCSTWFPDFVEKRQFERVERIDRIAVVPFTAADRLARSTGAVAGEGVGDKGGDVVVEEEGLRTSPAEAAALVTRFVSEALATYVPVIPENDVKTAFQAQGQLTPGQSPELAAMLAASEFGADAVLLGVVRRYRERVGSAVGSEFPASVEFEVALYAAPSGTKLWIGRFAHTQAPLTSDVFDSARLPGRGSRFLTAAELAQFGAQRVAEEVPLGR